MEVAYHRLGELKQLLLPCPVTSPARERPAGAASLDRGVTVIRGYNFSAGRACDSEDLNVLTSPEVAGLIDYLERACLRSTVPTSFTRTAAADIPTRSLRDRNQAEVIGSPPRLLRSRRTVAVVPCHEAFRDAPEPPCR